MCWDGDEIQVGQWDDPMWGRLGLEMEEYKNCWGMSMGIQRGGVDTEFPNTPGKICGKVHCHHHVQEPSVFASTLDLYTNTDTICGHLP